MKIHIVPKWVLPFGYGLTIYTHVFIRKDAEDIAYLKAHEERHVQQWQEIGMFKFPFVYLREIIKNGYRGNKYEQEAIWYGAKNRSKYE